MDSPSGHRLFRRIATPIGLLIALTLALGVAGCGPALSRQEALPRLRASVDREIDGAVALEDTNRLVEDIVQGGVLEGMHESEVREAIGRGDTCGTRDVCSRARFRSTDWVYDVGHAPGNPELPAGPMLVIGFDTTGRVNRTHYVVRRQTVTTRD